MFMENANGCGRGEAGEVRLARAQRLPHQPAAFVMGEATGQELASTILGLAQGEFRCPPRVAAMLVQRISARACARTCGRNA